jgi:uracil-DNA glycosylase family 4
VADASDASDASDLSATLRDATALAGLRDRITSCTACPRLVAWREHAAIHPPPAFAAERYWGRPLGGFGDVDARLILVGLAPAAHGGNRTGRMFTGDRSGDFLFAGLWRAGFANQPDSHSVDDGLSLRDAYVTAAVRCAPPDNKPLPDERDRCRPYLAEELSLLRHGTVYLALGAFAYDALSKTLPVAGALPRPRPRFAHGLEVRLTGNLRTKRLLCSYHPSQRNVFTGLLTAAMFDSVLARAAELIAVESEMPSA